MRFAMLGLILAAALVILPALPAAACGVSLVSLDETVGGKLDSGSSTISGVFETSVIAESPPLIYRGKRSVSVVTRYWGERPVKTGRERHGGGSFLGHDSDCWSDPTGDPGAAYYGFVFSPQGDFDRGLGWAIDTDNPWGDRLSVSEELMLSDRFGSPTVVEVTAATRRHAFVDLWRDPAIVLAVVGGSVAVIVYRRRQPHDGEPEAST